MSKKESYKIVDQFEVGKIYYHSSKQFASATRFFKVLAVYKECLTVISNSNYEDLLREDIMNLREELTNHSVPTHKIKDISEEKGMEFIDVLTAVDLTWHQPRKDYYLKNSLEVLDIDTFPFCMEVGSRKSNHIPVCLKDEDYREIRLHKLLN